MKIKLSFLLTDFTPENHTKMLLFSYHFNFDYKILHKHNELKLSNTKLVMTQIMHR